MSAGRRPRRTRLLRGLEQAYLAGVRDALSRLDDEEPVTSDDGSVEDPADAYLRGVRDGMGRDNDAPWDPALWEALDQLDQAPEDIVGTLFAEAAEHGWPIT